jgi:hypothetical protein
MDPNTLVHVDREGREPCRTSNRDKARARAKGLGQGQWQQAEKPSDQIRWLRVRTQIYTKVAEDVMRFPSYPH